MALSKGGILFGRTNLEDTGLLKAKRRGLAHRKKTKARDRKVLLTLPAKYLALRINHPDNY